MPAQARHPLPGVNVRLSARTGPKRALQRLCNAALVPAINAAAVPGVLGAVNALGGGPAVGEQTTEITAADRWVQVSPVGEFPNRAGLQVCDRTAFERIVATFNSAGEVALRHGRGLPIYVGHPDFAPKDYPDHRKYGALLELEARADGLYARPKWSKAGREMVNEEHFDFQSPYWLMEPVPGRPGAFRPVELVSIGLTNHPNIPGKPVGANHRSTPTADDPDPMKEKLIARFNLKPLDGATEVSDQQIEDALTAAANERTALDKQVKAANAAKEKAEKERTDALTASANERTARIAERLTGAVNSGRITDAEKAGWQTRLETDFENGAKALDTLKAAVNTTATSKTADLGKRNGGANGAASTGDQIAAAVNEALPQHNGDYNAAWAAVKKAKPALFAAANANP